MRNSLASRTVPSAQQQQNDTGADSFVPAKVSRLLGVDLDKNRPKSGVCLAVGVDTLNFH